MLLLEEPEYYDRSRFGYVRGSETVRYVREIDRRYRTYVEQVRDLGDAGSETEESGGERVSAR
jgi:membrane-bound lytic murein transglycosylase F